MVLIGETIQKWLTQLSTCPMVVHSTSSKSAHHSPVSGLSEKQALPSDSDETKIDSSTKVSSGTSPRCTAATASGNSPITSPRSPKCLHRYYDKLQSAETDNNKISTDALQENMVIIVAAVVLDENGRVLLIQEAKRSCRGKWYLPAGKLEPDGESIIEGVKREVQEEAGYIFEPSHLAVAESNGDKWYRFTFIGNIVGGSLKTTEQADRESLQASWFDMSAIESKEVAIRCWDCLGVIRKAVSFNAAMTKATPRVLPMVMEFRRIYTKLLLVANSSDDPLELSVLVLKDDYHTFILPAILVDMRKIYSRSEMIDACIRAQFSTAQHFPITLIGVVNIEFNQSNQKHGFATTYLYRIAQTHEIDRRSNAQWKRVTNASLKKDLSYMLQHPESCPAAVDLASTWL